MSVKASKSARASNSGAIGFGKGIDKASQNFIGGKIWMEKIQRGTLKIDPALADMTIDDILTNGGLNFQVLKVQTHFTSPVSGIEYPSVGYSVIRADDDYELGNGFAENYQPISYKDLLEIFFSDFKQLGGVPTRALSFDHGAVGGIQLSFGDGVLVADRPHKTFFNLLTSMNGQYANIINESDVCAICGNTFAYNMREKTNRYSVKHTKNMHERLAEIQRILVQSQESQKNYYSVLDKAATMAANSDTVKAFLALIHPDGKPNAAGKVNQGPANSRERLYKAIGDTAAESNKTDFSLYDVFQGQIRDTSYKTQNRDADAQWQYAMDSKDNQLAYSWLLEAVK